MMNAMLSLVVAACLLTSCSVGKKNVLFVTKTSLGVDLDASPPTMDIGFARKEGSLAPSVEGDALPVMSGIGGSGGLANSVFGAGASTNFAIGTPAVIVSQFLGSEVVIDRDKETLAKIIDPDERTEEGKKFANVGTIKKGERRRYFFGTDTILGFKVHLSEELKGIPDAAVVGWRRKELAYVPIQEQGDRLRVASMLATSDFNVEASGGDADAGYSQFYATGLAANHLAGIPFVRNVVAKRILRDKEVNEQLEANQNKLEAARDEGLALHKKASGVIEGLPTAKLDLARTELAGTGLIDLADAFRDMDGDGDVDPADKRAFLIEFSKVGNDTEEVEKLREFVLRLVALERRS